MFDTYHKHEKELVPYEKTIIEKRAPTDESIKIFHELVEKAKSSLIRLEDFHYNSINAKFAVYDDLLNFRIQCIIKINLNGNVLTSEFSMDNYEYRNDIQNFYDKLKANIAECITNYVLHNITANKKDWWE